MNEITENQKSDKFWLIVGAIALTLVTALILVKKSENDKFAPIKQQLNEENQQMNIRVLNWTVTLVLKNNHRKHSFGRKHWIPLTHFFAQSESMFTFEQGYKAKYHSYNPRRNAYATHFNTAGHAAKFLRNQQPGDGIYF